MNDFTNFLQAHGLIPRDVVADGKWYRCPTENHPKKRNGSYKLADDGRAGWCQDHAVHASPIMWRAEREYVTPKIDHAAIARRQSEERRALMRATEAAREFFDACEPLHNGHPYFAAHGLDMTGCYGLKVDGEGWLVVPARRDGELVSVQRISPTGDKRFWRGASVKGASYTIDRRDAEITVICEGLATGLAVYAATPMSRVIVAFDAGNLSQVPPPRRGLAVVAADNDATTADRLGTNPGIEAALQAANAIGCGVAIPQNIVGTDWCDWRQENVAEKMKRRRRFDTESSIRRAVDATLAATMMRYSIFLRSTQPNA